MNRIMNYQKDQKDEILYDTTRGDSYLESNSVESSMK